MKNVSKGPYSMTKLVWSTKKLTQTLSLTMNCTFSHVRGQPGAGNRTF